MFAYVFQLFLDVTIKNRFLSVSVLWKWEKSTEHVLFELKVMNDATLNYSIPSFLYHDDSWVLRQFQMTVLLKQ